MATKVQTYPRISDTKSKEEGLLDVSLLKPLPSPIKRERMQHLAKLAIKSSEIKANKKALEISDEMNAEELKSTFKLEGKRLFSYFKKPDPASIANYLYGRDSDSIAKEFLKKRKIHLDSMIAGWRYQYLLVGCAQESGRFKSVSDLNTGDSDVNIIVETIDKTPQISLYISMKNRKDTISGGAGQPPLLSP